LRSSPSQKMRYGGEGRGERGEKGKREKRRRGDGAAFGKVPPLSLLKRGGKKKGPAPSSGRKKKRARIELAIGGGRPSSGWPCAGRGEGGKRTCLVP